MPDVRRRELIALLGGAVAAWPLAAHAQQRTGKVWQVGMVDTATRELNRTNLDAFLDRLRELGYVEGKNVVIEWRRHEGKVDRLPALATELVRLKVDVIVVTGVRDLRSAKEATATIPIVMVVEVVSSPVWRKTPRC